MNSPNAILLMDVVACPDTDRGSTTHSQRSVRQSTCHQEVGQTSTKPPRRWQSVSVSVRRTTSTSTSCLAHGGGGCKLPGNSEGGSWRTRSPSLQWGSRALPRAGSRGRAPSRGKPL